MKFQWTSALIGGAVAGGGVFMVMGILWARDHSSLTWKLKTYDSLVSLQSIKCMAAKTGADVNCSPKEFLP